jgi:hypothetical protein
MGDYKEAYMNGYKSLKIRKYIYGDDAENADIANSYHELSKILKFMGMPD